MSTNSIFTHVSRQVLAGSLVIAALFAPRAAAAQESTAANPNATPMLDKPTSLKVTPSTDRSRWSLNFTPILLIPERNYDLGGGFDPELKDTLDRGGVRSERRGR